MGAPPAEGIPEVERPPARGGDFFHALRECHERCGSVYRSSLGPIRLVNVADPVSVRHVLTRSGAYDKGLLGLIAEDIFGQGLITATDREVWISRRKVVGPGFYRRWLEGLAPQFAGCTAKAIQGLDTVASFQEVEDLEAVYLNIALDIVGKAVFNFDFASVDPRGSQKESPIVAAVYRVLKETGYRAESPALLALAQLPPEFSGLLPEAREYRESLGRLNSVLDEVIEAARATGSRELGVEDLQERNLGGAEDRSLLRFLVDVRGQDASSKQLKDDLRTLLIAGHETVASVMTWATFELTRHPDAAAKVREELDSVLGDRDPTFDDVRQLEYLRLVVAETLRLYPAPPQLMRRALEDDVIPVGSAAQGPVPISRGTLVSLQMAMLHRHPDVFEDPDEFRPERWRRPFGPSGKVPDWRGYDSSRVTGLCPNEVAADFAFVPFGAGEFKCVGDQFAMVEATVVLAMLFRRYDFAPTYSSLEDVGIDIAATIHTQRGLNVRVSRRS